MNNFILGSGITGLAAGLASGWPIYEAEEFPGGICSSYYLRPGDPCRLFAPPADGEAYRFEIGGGHWLWIPGNDKQILKFLSSYAVLMKYARKSAVYFREKNQYVPYPIQNHLSYLPSGLARQALQEIINNGDRPTLTLSDWLEVNFGRTLCSLFFYPFHELYTAGLYTRIAPQDQFKSPVNKKLIIQGAQEKTPSVGYNATFFYPAQGLNHLSRQMAAKCRIHFLHRVVAIDIRHKEIIFQNGKILPYQQVISTLPLNLLLRMAELDVECQPDPYIAVLVLNLGARRGPKCPEEHWLYIPHSASGFHRVGFYSNVDVAFLPRSARKTKNRVSIYVERSFPAGDCPSPEALAAYQVKVVQELQSWGFIEELEVIDATWIPIAYTWHWPNSRWRAKSINALKRHGIYQAGRYAFWKNQGIADSFKDGWMQGISLARR